MMSSTFCIEEDATLHTELIQIYESNKNKFMEQIESSLRFICGKLQEFCSPLYEGQPFYICCELRSHFPTEMQNVDANKEIYITRLSDEYLCFYVENNVHYFIKAPSVTCTEINCLRHISRINIQSSTADIIVEYIKFFKTIENLIENAIQQVKIREEKDFNDRIQDQIKDLVSQKKNESTKKSR